MKSVKDEILRQDRSKTVISLVNGPKWVPLKVNIDPRQRELEIYRRKKGPFKMIGFTKLEHLNTNGEENFIKISYGFENNASIAEINCNGQKHSFPTTKNDGFEKIQFIKMDGAWPIRQLALTEWSNVTSSEKF